LIFFLDQCSCNFTSTGLRGSPGPLGPNGLPGIDAQINDNKVIYTGGAEK